MPYISHERVYLDRNGEPTTDPLRGQVLLVSAGGTLPDVEAERYGLIAAAKAVTEPPENKAVVAAPERKRNRPVKGGGG